MWNEPTLEELEALQMPRIEIVTRKAYQHRKVYMHFFNEEYDFFTGGYDSESHELFGYSIRNNSQGAEWGVWRRAHLDKLVSMKSSTEAELTRNLNFQPCRANDVEKIRLSEEYQENLRKEWEEYNSQCDKQ
tara:strand:+ start:14777 stop:15172 length:396 start_codon:yes stop_codon:yes gene_type:complete